MSTRRSGVWRRELRLPGTRWDAAALILLAGLALFLFRGAVFGGKVLFIRDINMVWVPQVEAFARCIASGSWPLWDPWRGFGQPLLADPSAQVLYPTTWLNLVAPPWVVYTVFVVAHLAFSSAGMYALGRQWGMSREAAFLAGAVWTASGPMLSLTTLWHHFAGAAWVPWVFLAADRALGTGRRGAALAWGAAAAAQVLAGSADVVIMTTLAVIAGAAALHVRWRSWAVSPTRRVLGSTLLAGVVGLGLSAALWVPTLVAARGSQRWGLPPEDRLAWSLHPAALAGVLWPLRLDRLPVLDLDPESVRELQGPWLYSLHLGAGTAILVVGALAAPAMPRKRYLAGVLLASVAMALGRHAPVYDAVTAVLPPLRMLRFPVKWMVLASAAWALLAGLGADAWRQAGDEERRWRRGAALAVSLLFLASAVAAALMAWRGALLRPLFRNQPPVDWHAAVVGPVVGAAGQGAAVFAAGALLALLGGRSARAARAAGGLAMLLALGELVVVHRQPQPLAPRELYTWRPAALDHLGPRERYERVYVYDYSVGAYPGQERGRPWGYPLARVPRGWSDEAGRVLGVHLYLNPPTAERWGVYGSFDLDLLGLHASSRRELNLLLRRVEGTPAHLKLLRMGAVSRVLALHEDRFWAGLVPIASVDSPFTTPIRVLEVPAPLPRAYVVSGVRVADGAEALSALQDPAFDPQHEVLLPRGAPVASNTGKPGAARIEMFKPDRIRVVTDLERPGYLVLADGYDPGWRAEVDGRPTEVLRANLDLRAAAVPTGRHVVEFRYRPLAAVAGLALSMATAVAVLGILRLSAGGADPEPFRA